MAVSSPFATWHVIAMMDRIAQLLRDVASSVVMPRFQALRSGDIEEKSPGEIVTIADREAEAAITSALLSLRPGSRVVGEEASAVDPSQLSALDQGDVWLVDPLDGTANFAAGRTPFALMVALLSNGETIAAWMLDPVTGRLAVTERGSGAWMDGNRVTTAKGSRGADQLRGAVFGRFMPPDIRTIVEARAGNIGEQLPGYMCCGAEYPAIATGEQDFALYWRTLPWDHAPGALFLTEAGGHVARPGGETYRAASGGGGLLAARCAESWDQAHAALLR
jgi:fructose-1,6-bisphosphatase/inositol monophosphatase family enzyme